MGMLFMYNTICFVLFCFVFVYCIYFLVYVVVVWYFLLLYCLVFLIIIFILICLVCICFLFTFMSIDVYIAFVYVPCKSSHRLNGSLNFKFQISNLNEQVAYKRGVAGPKQMAPEVIIANMAAL